MTAVAVTPPLRRRQKMAARGLQSSGYKKDKTMFKLKINIVLSFMCA